MWGSVAVAAGLGSFGKSSLIVTPEFGPRVRWVAIITNAELNANKPRILPISELCGDCGVCTKMCPKKAISYDDQSSPPENPINFPKCSSVSITMQCALCMALCPHGKENRPKKKKLA